MNVTKKTVVSKYKMGDGWVVSQYDPEMEMWRESHPMDFYAANRALREARESWDTKTQSYREERR